MSAEPNAHRRVEVDLERCVHTLQCTYHAPAVFDVDDDGEMTYTEDVPAGAGESAERAAELCPSQAIRVTRHVR